MADEADRAQAVEEMERTQAVRRVLDRPAEIALVNSDGDRICRDCGERIPRRRLYAAPHAVRCMFCQVAHEEGC